MADSTPNSPLTPCPNCGAIMDCCAMSKVRGETADSLSLVVDRQSAAIRELRRERDEARQVIADLRAKPVINKCRCGAELKTYADMQDHSETCGHAP